MDNQHKSGGSTRRDLLKRGAVAGGTLLWATPVIQSLDLRAAAAAAGTEKPPPPTIAEKMPPSVVTTTTSPDERPPFPPAGQAIQHLDFLISSAGVVYGARYEAFGDGGAFVAPEKAPEGASLEPKQPDCLGAFPDWTPATKELLDALNVKGSVQTLGDGDLRQYVVLVPPGITVVAAYSKCGGRCAPPDPWKTGLLFHPCPPETEVGPNGVPVSPPTTTTTSTTSTTSTTTTSTTTPPKG
jgi:hypothetical protein